MSTRLRSVWTEATASLWFLPALLIMGFAGLAVLLVDASSLVDRAVLIRHPRFFGASAGSSASMLSTIAGSMMTVAGVTFSITVLAVTQASSHYTPRILRNFMRDRPSQVALGTLNGVFVYCLIVLRTVRSEADLQFIPALAVLGAIVLALIGIRVLVFFIHHIAGSLQVNSILDRLRRQTVASIVALFPARIGEGAPGGDAVARATQSCLEQTGAWTAVSAPATGYLTRVHGEALLDFASAHDCVVRMRHGIGDYVIADTPLCEVAGAPVDASAAARLAGLFDIAPFRTVEQDAAFGVQLIVDIAIKALSPGINDTTTAVSCVDCIGAVLVAVASRHIASALRLRDGALRVIARGPDFESLTAMAVEDIRRNAEGNVVILHHLLDTIGRVMASTADRTRRAVLAGHAARAHEAAERSVTDAADRAALATAYRRALAP